MPYFVELGAYNECPNVGSASYVELSTPGVMTSVKSILRDINQDIASYYRLHSVHEIAVTALKINHSIETELAQLIDL